MAVTPACNQKRALVTGSTTGLGEAIAKQLAEEGGAVVIHGRNAGRAQQVADSIRAAGGQAAIALGDLATDAGADAVVAQALEGGAIDILVNNAGYYHHLNWTTALPETWMETYQVNVLSAVRMIQRLVPAIWCRTMSDVWAGRKKSPPLSPISPARWPPTSAAPRCGWTAVRSVQCKAFRRSTAWPFFGSSASDF